MDDLTSHARATELLKSQICFCLNVVVEARLVLEDPNYIPYACWQLGGDHVGIHRGSKE